MFMDNNQGLRKADLSSGILRQRRNLLVLSIVMPLFSAGSLTVEKVNILGSIVKVGSKTEILLILISMFFYFLIRYWQYSREELRAKDFLSERDQALQKVEEKYFEGLLEPLTKCFDSRRIYSCFESEEISPIGFEKPPIRRKLDKRISFFTRSRVMEVYGLPSKYSELKASSSEEKEQLTENEIRKIKKFWKLMPRNNDETRSGPIYRTEVQFNIIKCWGVLFLEKIKFLILNPYFTDYVLPYWFAFASLGITFYNLQLKT